MDYYFQLFRGTNSFTFHGLSAAEVDSNTESSVRETARLQSIGDGAGMQHKALLNAAAKTGCARKTCKCVRSNVLCHSRCHNRHFQ